jgi:hypothetical protein
VKLDEAKLPSPAVVLMPDSGFVHDTGTGLASTETVG